MDITCIYEWNVEKNIIKGGIKIVEHLNLFTVLHAFWVVEMYYLGINAIFNMNVYFDQEVIKKIPNVILKYNETFLSYFKDYNEVVCLFGTAILFCGLANIFIKFIPYNQ